MSEAVNNYKPKLSSAELEANFADIAPAFDGREAHLESSRCLFCFDAPCIKACPTHINIPQFIRQIGTGDTIGAAKTIFTENILGSSCGRVCPTEVLCEGACVYNNLNEKPIEIGRLQRFATDAAIEAGKPLFHKEKDSGKRVALIGAGPASLSCAHELTLRGHRCVVFEAGAAPGGLNTTGIAGYKLDTPASLKEVSFIQKIGIDIRLNSPVGEKTKVEDLLREYDAVFLGVGLGETASLGIEGEDTEGCLEALEFIAPTRASGYVGAKIGEEVLVIGGGNTAIDAATAAVRLGAPSVTIVYRRTKEAMPAFEYEYKLAQLDGVKFRWLTAPLRVKQEKGRVVGLECTRLKASSDKGGRGRLETVPGSEHVIPCDMIIKALGQNPLAKNLEKISGLKLTDGIVQVDTATGATSVAGLFAGGDCITGGGEVVDAVQHGKIAARGLHAYLTAKR